MLPLAFVLATQPQPAALQEPLEMKVEAALAKLTLEEKIDLLGGVDGFFVRALPTAGLPKLKMTDGPMGARNDGPTTAYPAGCIMAATWNPSLAKSLGAAMGRDSRARGAHFLLGPGVNLARIVQNGRGFEYLGEDPLLAGSLSAEIVKGIQSKGVSAVVKHFACNEHESDRNNDDSIIDSRALRELYLRPFEMAVREGRAAGIMTSYNLVNGVHASESRALNVEILKGDWKFKGVVMSDWVSTYSTEGTYLGGLDIEMPWGKHLNREKLLPLIQSGKLSQKPLDDKVRRILRVAYQFGWDKRPQLDSSISKDDPANAQLAIQAAREGITLLKNRGQVLPIIGKKTVLVVGPNADPAVTGGGGSSFTTPFRAVSVVEALTRKAGAGVKVTYSDAYSTQTIDPKTTKWKTPEGTDGLKVDYFRGISLEGSPILSRTEKILNMTFPPSEVTGPFSARWQGTLMPEGSGLGEVVVRVDDGARVYVDDKLVIDQWHDQAAAEYVAKVQAVKGKPIRVVVEYYQRAGEAVAQAAFRGPGAATAAQKLSDKAVAESDVVIACVGFQQNGSIYEGEGSDRPWELPAPQVAMLRRLVSLNKNVVVVLNAGHGVDALPWIDKAAGFVFAGYPGGEGNLALAEILFGQVSPSGKLPFTYPKTLAGTYYVSAYPSRDKKMVYREGIFMGYRWFDKNGVEPLYPFGHGLSYSSFAFSQPRLIKGDSLAVKVKVLNSGRMRASETVQVYAELPKSPVARPRQVLAGYQKVTLEPGKSKLVTVTVNRDSLKWWNEPKHQWVLDKGTYRLKIGSSSRSLPLSVSVKL